MEDNFTSAEALDASINNQRSETIIKRIHFNKETYKDLVTIASREYFDTKMKQDEMVSAMLDQIINSYYKQYWNINKPN